MTPALSGRTEPNGPTDQQCRHCGLYYHNRGYGNHVHGCPLKGRDLVLQRVEENGEDVDSSSESSTVEEDRNANSSAVNAVPQFEVVEDDEAGDNESDSGNGDQEDSGNTVKTLDCPECGVDTGMSSDDLEPGHYDCESCQTRLFYPGE